MNRGIFDKMIDDSVQSYMGYIQLHQKGYWEDRILDNAFEYRNELQVQLQKPESVKAVVPRLESMAMASFGKQTKNVAVTGISPDAENQLTKLKSRLVAGQYLEANEQAILIGEGLAKKLKVSLGDSVILLSQGYRGVNAAQIYPIKGILSFGKPELSAAMVYLPLQTAQYYYGADRLVTSLVIDIEHRKEAPKVIQSLAHTIDTTNTYELLAWQQLIPDIMELKSTKEASNSVVIFILYFIVGFGIFGTILMMTKERTYEFGVLLSIGMKRQQLAFSVWIESLLLGIIGAIIGIIIAYALTYYLMINPIVMQGDMAEAYIKFGMDPIMPASTDLDIFWTQALIVLSITTLLALYPCITIWRMKPVEAMRA
jgi:ABC-type lipoprotein release transport system permease subunit